MARDAHDEWGERPEPSDATRDKVALLYRAHACGIRRRLRARLGSDEDAGELLHEAFTRLLGARPTGQLRNPGAFLNRILHNLLIDRARRRSTRPAHVRIDDEADLAVAPDQSYAIELEQVHQRYTEILESLPPRMREVFLLHRVDGLGYKEIAERLDISIRTVEWHFAQAIVRIGRGLEGE